LDAEIKTYFQEPLEDQLVNPLQFWLMKKDLFPTLSLMAGKFLAVPSTSTPSERAFSQGRLILHYSRANLSAAKLKALMCLNNWFSLDYV